MFPPGVKNIGIVGLGLIGGSLARALKQQNKDIHIIGFTKSPESTQLALELGIADEICPAVQNLPDVCDIIVICTPLATYADIFKELASGLKDKQPIITDVGSVKHAVIADAKKYLLPNNFALFVPSHPIAGTEKTGVEAGFAELFIGKKTIITPLELTDKTAIETVTKLWQQCGSNVEIMPAKDHDKIYAEISHLPQFLAYCYVMLLAENKNLLMGNVRNNPNFLQFSRICASPANIWADIFILNQENIQICLDIFSDILRRDHAGIATNAGLAQHDLIKSIPEIIGFTLKKCSLHAAQYAGSGFRDFTCMAKETKQTPDVIIGLLNAAQQLMSVIKTGNSKAISDFLEMPVNFYKNLL